MDTAEEKKMVKTTYYFFYNYRTLTALQSSLTWSILHSEPSLSILKHTTIQSNILQEMFKVLILGTAQLPQLHSQQWIPGKLLADTRAASGLPKV